MKWFHQVDPTWLDARREYVTASEICKLLPTTPTGRPRNTAEVTRKVWAAKQCEPTEDNIVSTGVMARGHLMERYAIDAINKAGLFHSAMRHWDDCLVYSPDGVSCSPDCLNVDQPEGVIELDGSTVDADFVIEVKSYNAEQHYECGMFSGKMNLTERWQLATAMYCMPSIFSGTLVFFNPSAKHRLFLHHYTRAELMAELEAIEQIAAAYWADVATFSVDAEIKCPQSLSDMVPDEADIIADLIAEQEKSDSGLNP